MAVQVIDTPEATVTIETRPAGDGTPDAAKTTTVAPKPGTPQDNLQNIVSQALNVLPTLESNYTNWTSLTVAQKDAANRLAQRVNAKIIRYLLNQLDSAGP